MAFNGLRWLYDDGAICCHWVVDLELAALVILRRRLLALLDRTACAFWLGKCGHFGRWLGVTLVRQLGEEDALVLDAVDLD